MTITKWMIMTSLNFAKICGVPCEGYVMHNFLSHEPSIRLSPQARNCPVVSLQARTRSEL